MDPDHTLTQPDDGRMEDRMPQSDPTGAPSVTVRYWAAAREAAGVDTDLVPLAQGTDRDAVSVVLGAVERRHPALITVLQVSSILVDGRVVGPDETVGSGDVVEVLPPFAGG